MDQKAGEAIVQFREATAYERGQFHRGKHILLGYSLFSGLEYRVMLRPERRVAYEVFAPPGRFFLGGEDSVLRSSLLAALSLPSRLPLEPLAADHKEPAKRKQSAVRNSIAWDKQPLGKLPDAKLAKILRVAPTTVRYQRKKRNIAPCWGVVFRETVLYGREVLGMSDKEMARELGLSRQWIYRLRKEGADQDLR